MKQVVMMVVLLLVTALSVSAQTKSGAGSIENLILQLENEGREATLKNDLEANDRMLADNWVNVNADGSVTTKAKLLELIKDGNFKISSIDNDEVMVRVYGDDLAIVTGRSTSKRTQGGEVLTRQVRFTRVYAKNSGRWQVVSAHNTPIRQP